MPDFKIDLFFALLLSSCKNKERKKRKSLRYSIVNRCMAVMRVEKTLIRRKHIINIKVNKFRRILECEYTHKRTSICTNMFINFQRESQYK